MKAEMNKYIELLKISIAKEHEKEWPDIDKLEELAAGLFYLDRAVKFMGDYEIELIAERADVLCSRSQSLIEDIMQPLLYNPYRDPQNLGS